MNGETEVDGVLSSLKRKAVLSHATPWMNLEDMMLSKKQASHKKTNSV